MNPEQELSELYRMREYINQRINDISATIKHDSISLHLSGGKIYVLTSELKPYVQEWVNLGYSLNVLADKAIVSEATLLNILRLKTEYTRENIADKILTALDMPQVRLEIYEHKQTLIPKPPQGYFEE